MGEVKVPKLQSKYSRPLRQPLFKMARFQKWLLLMLLVTPIVLQLAQPVAAEEDEVEDETVVEDEEVAEEEPAAEEVEDLDSLKNVDPDAETTLLFTKPTQVAGGSVELPAGKIVEFLVGFANKGLKDFVIDSIDASFRYPMDFTYHIQNFSAIAYQKTVKEGQEATVAYSFIPADAFAGRPIGLSINLAYRDLEGNFFMDPVFNETVQIVEFDEGFDSEVFLCMCFLLLVYFWCF